MVRMEKLKYYMLWMLIQGGGILTEQYLQF